MKHKQLKWWMRIIGAFYLILFVGMSIVQAPPGAYLSALGVTPDPQGATFRLLVNTWVALGLEIGVVGVALLIASREPAEHTLLVWVVLGMELMRGIVADIYWYVDGVITLGPLIFWLVVHSAIIIWGLIALRQTQQTGPVASAAATISRTSS